MEIATTTYQQKNSTVILVQLQWSVDSYLAMAIIQSSYHIY